MVQATVQNWTRKNILEGSGNEIKNLNLESFNLMQTFKFGNPKEKMVNILNKQ